MRREMVFSVIDTPVEKFTQITFHGGQQRIFAEGPIDAAAPERFQRFVRDLGITWAKVHFDSPGGNLMAGLALGHAIRDLQFDTAVEAKHWEYGNPPAALCASAAAYAFAGGKHRFYNEDAGSLGVHQFHDGKHNQGDFGVAQQVSGSIVAYLHQMGVDARVFSLAASTSSSDMIWLSGVEAVSLGFANNGTDATTAEIKVKEGQMYLRLEQRHHNVTARVLLFPAPDGFAVVAGIVTSKELSEMKTLSPARNYLELDWNEFLPADGSQGLYVDDCTIWVTRALPEEMIAAFMRSETVGIWLENGGPMRWGAMMDLVPVQSAISDFVDGCRASAS
jgi:hypothetical protein